VIVMSLQDTLDKLKEFDVNDLNNIDINNVGLWPLAGKIAAWFAVFIIVLAILFQVDLRGRHQTLKQEEQKEESLRAEFEKKVNDAANLEEYKAQMVEMEASFEALLKQLPQDTEVPGLLDDISSKGLDSGLTFRTIDLKKEVSAEYYVELPIQLTVDGGYHDFGTFSSGIAGLPRIVTLDDFSIKPVAGNKGSSSDDMAEAGELSMVIMARTYRYKPGAVEGAAVPTKSNVKGK
jgi:type IV pilus assembly protein PilO